MLHFSKERHFFGEEGMQDYSIQDKKQRESNLAMTSPFKITLRSFGKLW